MNPLILLGVNVLVHVLKAAPSIQGDIRQAFQESWGTDHVQDAVQGLRVVSSIVDDLVGLPKPADPPAASIAPAPAAQQAAPPAPPAAPPVAPKPVI